MKVGDLVYDYSMGQSGLIVESRSWAHSTLCNDTEFHILYEDGEFDWAYENELKVMK